MIYNKFLEKYTFINHLYVTSFGYAWVLHFTTRFWPSFIISLVIFSSNFGLYFSWISRALEFLGSLKAAFEAEHVRLIGRVGFILRVETVLNVFVFLILVTVSIRFDMISFPFSSVQCISAAGLAP